MRTWINLIIVWREISQPRARRAGVGRPSNGKSRWHKRGTIRRSGPVGALASLKELRMVADSGWRVDGKSSSRRCVGQLVETANPFPSHTCYINCSPTSR